MTDATTHAPVPFPLVEIEGPPRERGRLYGQRAAERVAKSVSVYAGAIGKQGVSLAELRAAAEAFLPAIARFEPAYAEEIRGIAEGSKHDLAEIVMINARTELLAFAKRRKEAADPAVKDGCTGAVILPDASADGSLIHGQNWDWRAECVENTVVLHVRREDGPDVLTFTEAGALGRSGLNGAGIAITANFLESNLDHKRHGGVPLPLIRRKVLECAHFAEAIRVIAATPKSGSNNLMISSAAGDAIGFECLPDEAIWYRAEAGLMVHANHFVTPAARAKATDRGVLTTPDSLYRDARVRAALERNRPRLTADHLKAAFFDDWGTPFSVCRPPRPAVSGDNISATVAMVIMRPAERVMEIAPLPAFNRDFTTYRLPAPAAATRRAAE
ncbi:MAG: acyl-CoA--6-aminopenicillanic acid acyltransferase [Alphaproteobacteria bacterium]|nr:acyl-CoA--6-aminopenicillanic acid acyltransferase [Alphaproteobacteria bacterium]